MNSQPEHGTGGRGREVLPVPLLDGATTGGSAAVRLEFASIWMPGSKTVVEGHIGSPLQRSVMLEEEKAAVEAQMQFERHKADAALEAALHRGRVQGGEEAAAELERRVMEERMQVVRTCEGFRQERENYFAGVEAEVVKLALAIAARVLHREVTLDPMLLRGVVRVALEKMMAESGTVLRVPVENLPGWLEVMEGEDAGTVEVTGDARLAAGECVLETSVGRVELGVAAQLEEIEKGFFDLLQQRPA